MSFTLGGDGTILPPRKKKDGLDRVTGVVEQSAPAFTEPGIRVISDGQTNRLPMDTPKNVVEIGSRKRFRSLPEAVQSAVAKSGGVVIPIANLRDTQDAGIAAKKSTPYSTPGVVDKSNLCRLVAITEAARRGAPLKIGNTTYSVDQVKAAAVPILAVLQKALDAGLITAEDIARCRKIANDTGGGGGGDAGTGTGGGDTGTGTGTDTGTGTGTGTDTGDGGGAGTGDGSGGGGGGTGQDTTPPADEKKKEGLGNLWWLVALIGGGLLIKKLAAVKVIGAAVAGVPLVAEMDDSEETEESEQEEHGEPPEAHDSEE